MSQGVGAAQVLSLAPGQNPTIDHEGPPDPTLIYKASTRNPTQQQNAFLAKAYSAATQWRRQDLLRGGAIGTNLEIMSWGTHGELQGLNFLYDDIVHVLQNTIDSCMNSATDRRGYVLERMCLPNSVK